MSLVGNNVVAIVPQVFVGVQPINYQSTTDSTSTSTGSLVCNSVIANKNINSNTLSVGGNVTVSNNVSTLGGSITISSVNNSTSTSTGALTTLGGLGCQGNTSIGASCNSISDSNFSNTLAVEGIFRVSGSTLIPAGIYTSSGSVTGVNSTTSTAIYTIIDGTRGFLLLNCNINSIPTMFLMFFEFTSTVSNASFNIIASSGNAQPGGNGMGSGGSTNLIFSLSVNVLSAKTVSGTGAVNYSLLYL